MNDKKYFPIREYFLFVILIAATADCTEEKWQTRPTKALLVYHHRISFLF